MFFSPQSNALVYNVPDPLRIAAVCHTARLLDTGQVVVPADLPNLQALRRLDLPIIEPMRHYDWPMPRDLAGKTPFNAQRVTANFLAANPRAFVLSDMGTGKTMAALWAADFIMSHYAPGQCRALIVSPLSTLKRVWTDAIFKAFLGRRTCEILHGTAKQRLDALSRNADFYIVNHDGLGVGASSNRNAEFTGLAAALQLRQDIRIAIVDEGSAYRDATTKRHRVARTLLGPRDYLWLLTGTPTPNGPEDAYGLAKLVTGARDLSFRSYRDSVMMQVSQFKWVPRQGSAEIVQRTLSPAVRFAIEDCVDLPGCTVQAREAELSPEQNKAYKDLKRELSIAINNQAVTAANEGVLRMKLIQIACGAVYDSQHKAHNLNPVNRIAVLEEVLDQAPHKVIVFSGLTSVIQLLQSKLSKRSVAVVNGAVSARDRDEIFRRFMEEDRPEIILADPATMSHGLTLTAASTIVWYAPVDRTELYLQANARINRPGQKHKTAIVQISATPIEREIYRRLEANESLQGVILKMVEE